MEKRSTRSKNKLDSKNSNDCKKSRRILLGIVVFVVILVGTAGIYVADDYPAGSTAKNILEEKNVVIREQNWLYLNSPSDEVGIIFYPGAKVEYTAYLPLMKELYEEGLDCFLVEMPFNLAILGSNRAEAVMAAHPEIKTWYMAGHSMGGAFASNFASKHSEDISGVILLGAYLYGDYPAEKSLTIYGSEDQVLNRDKITYEDHVYVIDGGNHAQFGDYGVQKGDGTASISPEEQWRQAVELIMDFL